MLLVRVYFPGCFKHSEIIQSSSGACVCVGVCVLRRGSSKSIYEKMSKLKVTLPEKLSSA